jgi:serpin B
MKKFFYFIAYSLSVVLSFQNCQSQPVPVSDDVKTIVASNSQFALDLYHELANQPSNFFCSPYSISAAFAMTVAGAKGVTALEMQKVLHLPVGFFPVIGELNEFLMAGNKSRNAGSQLWIANGVWIQKQLSVLQAFQLAIKRAFGSHFELVDFANSPLNATKTINQWVMQQTNGKIAQLLTPQEISTLTRLVLTSAIYMKGQWVHPFNKSATVLEPFITVGNHPLQTYMMKIVETYPLFIGPTFDLIELPYLSSDSGLQLSMLIILPHQDHELDQIEPLLSYDQWHQWLTQLKPRRVQLTLPKFRLEDRLDLNQPLQEMGMTKPFSPLADFSGITGTKDLFINKAIHKTYIHVDENGTEAAAATGVVMNLTAVLEREAPYILTVNRPFCLFIIDRRTQSILFMGRIIQL